MDLKNLFFETKDFELNQKIGSGAFGCFHIVTNVNDGKKYIAKTLKIHELSGKEQMNFINEAIIHSKLHHPAISKLFGINFHSFDDEELLHPTIIENYFPKGSLYDILSLERRSSSDTNWNYTKKLINIIGIAHAMKYMHSQAIAHRNLKPGNIYLDDNYYPHISDFAYSDICTVDSDWIDLIGTPLYMAPEIIKGTPYGLPVDVFSFSIIMFEIITGEEPYKANGRWPSQIELAKKVSNGERPIFTDDISEPMINLIERCWNEDPDERPSFSEIYQQISSNFKSYTNYDIDEEEIENYIEMLNESEK